MVCSEAAQQTDRVHAKPLCRRYIVIRAVTEHDRCFRRAMRLVQVPFRNSRIGLSCAKFRGGGKDLKETQQIPAERA